jgi:hypothetical protein
MKTDNYDYDLLNADRDSIENSAIRMANALNDINNLYGEIPVIKKIMFEIDYDIRCFKGLRLN